MSAIENDDAYSTRDQLVEAPHDAGRVGERELGSRVAHRRNVSFIHAHNHSRDRASEEHRAFADDRASPADSQREGAAVFARYLDPNLARPSHLDALTNREFSFGRRLD
jgi:hypothetical protein